MCMRVCVFRLVTFSFSWCIASSCMLVCCSQPFSGERARCFFFFRYCILHTPLDTVVRLHCCASLGYVVIYFLTHAVSSLLVNQKHEMVPERRLNTGVWATVSILIIVECRCSLFANPPEKRGGRRGSMTLGGTAWC